MDDVSALLIKLADRLHNMRTIGALSRCKQVRMASETLDVFAVLANRLGAWAIKAELEDLSFKALNPEEYQLVQQAVAARTAAAAAASSGGAGLAAGIDELTRALQAAGLEVVDVSGRVKNVYGVWKKIQKHLGAACGSRSDDRSSRARTCRGASDDSGEQQHAAAQPQPAAAAGSSPRLSPAAAAAAAGSSFGSSKERATAIRAAITHIHDVQALRVVVPHKHDCYAAMRVVQDLWTAMPGRVKDYIRQRKANGYQVCVCVCVCGVGVWMVGGGG
jgi:(p)ppGpp synthase/HD superfamily hydrolase